MNILSTFLCRSQLDYCTDTPWTTLLQEIVYILFKSGLNPHFVTKRYLFYNQTSKLSDDPMSMEQSWDSPWSSWPGMKLNSPNLVAAIKKHHQKIPQSQLEKNCFARIKPIIPTNWDKTFFVSFIGVCLDKYWKKCTSFRSYILWL